MDPQRRFLDFIEANASYIARGLQTVHGVDLAEQVSKLEFEQRATPSGQDTMTDAHNAKAREIAKQWLDWESPRSVVQDANEGIEKAIAAALRDCERQPYEYARRLAEHLAAKHWPENTGWSALPDLMGVLSQIDNMTTGLVHKDRLAEVEREALERAAQVLEGYRQPANNDFNQGANWIVQHGSFSIRALSATTRNSDNSSCMNLPSKTP
jgi:hypothetical protein